MYKAEFKKLIAAADPKVKSKPKKLADSVEGKDEKAGKRSERSVESVLQQINDQDGDTNFELLSDEE